MVRREVLVERRGAGGVLGERGGDGVADFVHEFGRALGEFGQRAAAARVLAEEQRRLARREAPERRDDVGDDGALVHFEVRRGHEMRGENLKGRADHAAFVGREVLDDADARLAVQRRARVGRRVQVRALHDERRGGRRIFGKERRLVVGEVQRARPAAAGHEDVGLHSLQHRVARRRVVRHDAVGAEFRFGERRDAFRRLHEAQELVAVETVRVLRDARTVRDADHRRALAVAE
mmetsp:Transcript_1174/g.3490  ORF Transcript_1174/g.3490 Transcript_1174/m.3490 type:complete len:235 (+) Transcript_1174:445-1149(+)